jgi:hypothetical protein
MIVGVRAFQDKGKTALAIGTAKELVLYHGYSTAEVVVNLNLRWPDCHVLTNPQMRQYITRMVTHGLKHKIIILDEVDRLFPARFWHDKEQTEALIGLWQDVKLFNWIIYTAHKGTGTDIILRECTQVELEPEYDELRDLIDFTVYNAIDGLVYDDALLNVSKTIFPDYDRWEPIGMLVDKVKEPQLS